MKSQKKTYSSLLYILFLILHYHHFFPFPWSIGIAQNSSLESLSFHKYLLSRQVHNSSSTTFRLSILHTVSDHLSKNISHIIQQSNDFFEQPCCSHYAKVERDKQTNEMLFLTLRSKRSISLYKFPLLEILNESPLL